MLLTLKPVIYAANVADSDLAKGVVILIIMISIIL